MSNSYLAKVVPWGRSHEEYARMFHLEESDMERRILGCADGPASFNAEMTRLEKSVVSADPIYRFTREQIQQRIDEVFETMVAAAAEKANSFVWKEIKSPDHLGRTRLTAMNQFLEDYVEGLAQGRYICASLPELPFENNEFDLALCSHYLFTYSQAVSETSHLEAILEMTRVAGEVRVFPLLDMFDGGPSIHLERVMRDLDALGLSVTTETVPYEFQRGGNKMLRVIRR